MINKFLLAGDAFLREIRLRQLNLPLVLVDYLPNIMKKYKNLKKKEI